jgi:hypothetical protein
MISALLLAVGSILEPSAPVLAVLEHLCAAGDEEPPRERAYGARE